MVTWKTDLYIDQGTKKNFIMIINFSTKISTVIVIDCDDNLTEGNNIKTWNKI